MSSHTLLEKNRHWVATQTARDPEYFVRLAKTHSPKYLFIGCSDARVPADVLTQTKPGEMFVHRNIANMVVPTDNNLLAVLQYGVEALGIEDIIVCGHEGCGGVRAALGSGAPPLVDNWLTNIRTVVRLHADELDMIEDLDDRAKRLVELNVQEQVYNICRIPVVQAAWAKGISLRVHGWVYALHQGLLRDLDVTIDGSHAAKEAGQPPRRRRREAPVEAPIEVLVRETVPELRSAL
jgi:carbonic anhydrase